MPESRRDFGREIERSPSPLSSRSMASTSFRKRSGRMKLGWSWMCFRSQPNSRLIRKK